MSNIEDGNWDDKCVFLSVKQFASKLGAHPNTIRKAIKCKKINAFRLGYGVRSSWRIPESEILRMASFDLIKYIDDLAEKKAKEYIRRD